MTMKWMTPSEAPKWRRPPGWLGLGLRMALLFCVPVGLIGLADQPHTRASQLLNTLASLSLVVSWFVLWLAVPRYHRRRNSDLLDLGPPLYHLTRVAGEDAWWNPLVLRHTQFAAEGTVERGSSFPFSMRASILVPWYPWSRYAAAIRIDAPGSRAVAWVGATTAMVFPAQAESALRSILPDVQGRLRELGAEIVISTTYVQAFTKRGFSIANVSDLVRLALRLHGELQTMEPERYRDGAAPPANREDVVKVEVAAEKVWGSFRDGG